MQSRQNFYNLQSFSKLDLNNKKIGILGGSFNPPHEGHLKISKEALKIGMDCVLWLVAKQNPLKAKYLFSMEERVSQACSITYKIPHILVSNLELEIDSHNSYETICYLTEKFKNTSFYWLMGIDCLKEFHLWENYDIFCEKVNMIIFNRDSEEELFNTTKAGLLLKNKYENNILFIKENLSNLSSTELRKKL